MSRIALTQPYPGLRFYDRDQEAMFAGRHEAVEECAGLLVHSNVLILHGRTGCGKSSFLQAGVKPYLDQAGLPISFEHHDDGFAVIRSTDLPLRRVADKMREVVADLAQNGGKFGLPRGKISRDDLEAPFKDSKLGPRIGKKADATLAALDHLASTMRVAPIFVIDQAEEVFTLHEKQRITGANSSAAISEGLSLRQIDREVEEYFAFLQAVASSGLNRRIVVSLRTEYKGQFDDRIAHSGHPGKGLQGYYLSELGRADLIEAIVRPTLNDAEWTQRWTAQAVRTPKRPFKDFNFCYDKRVPEELADQLLGEDVPAGGVLPALQVACLRLWKQSELAAVRGERFEIGMMQLRQLGKIKDQVEEYLGQVLEETCEKNRKWKGKISYVVQDWQRVMKHMLVDLQADGRAVTRSVARSELAKAVAHRVKEEEDDTDHLPAVERALDSLVDEKINILRPDARAGYLTLGHDSLALALNRLSIVFEREDSMMTRMGTMGKGSDFHQDDLFADGEAPHRTTVYLHRDFQWDRAIPEYAEKKGFAERLGIDFKTPEHLIATNPNENGAPRTWEDLCRRISDTREQTDQARAEGRAQERMLVAAEWAAFPGFDIKRKTPIKPERWTDVLVTDIFLGNSLVGDNAALARLFDDVEKLKADQQAARYRELIPQALMGIVQAGGRVKCFDDSGKNFLRAAALFTGCREFHARIDDPALVSTLSSAKYQTEDPLFAWLVEGDGQPGPRFIVGSAMSRTLAAQAGRHAFFEAQHVIGLAKDLMDRRIGEKSDGDLDTEAPYEKQIKDISKEVQEILCPTLWQVSVPATEWNLGINRAFVLRLASLGYFTIEHMRTKMDDFVMHVQESANDIFEDAGKGENSVRGLRLSRWLVRETIRDCYRFMRFDEYGSEIYDLDSIFAYWSNHKEWNAKSVAGEIYNELTDLRQKTIAHFEDTTRSIAWLKYRKSYDPRDKDIARVFNFKRLAWNNFRIFNFYDSERCMARAALNLRTLIETVEKRRRKPATGAEHS